MTLHEKLAFSHAALSNIAETGLTDAAILDDIASLHRGLCTPEALLRGCMDGADSDREQGWRDYVDAVQADAEK